MREKKRKDKREDRKEAVRQSRGMIKISSLLFREGFASVRSTLAGVAETGSEIAQRLEGCERQSLSRLAPTAPFT